MTEPNLPPGINVFSGETGLGAALTNPTSYARHKGGIDRDYEIVYGNHRYKDVETAYLRLADPSHSAVDENDDLMAELIASKFEQHPDLAESVRHRGGASWLARCSHFTGAKSAEFQEWEGAGRASRFIRNLVRGYERACGLEPRAASRQHSLF
jgi:hypothetical protein